MIILLIFKPAILSGSGHCTTRNTGLFHLGQKQEEKPYRAIR
jgi:hypothetical protein